MATYTCLADLQGKTLKLNDVVYLKDIRYTVDLGFLNEDSSYNDKIFHVLSISSKEGFASNAYGYKCNGGAWPECKPHDYEALTRCVIELYKIIESSVITGFKIKGSYIKQLDLKEARKLFEGHNVCFNEDKWAFDSMGWYYWNTQNFLLCYNAPSADPGPEYQDITPIDAPTDQWYKITTPGKTGIPPEEVKNLILKYGGRLTSDFSYNSELGVYTWTKNKEVHCLCKGDVRADAIEVSPTTKITTIKQEEKHENQFQRKKARIERGTRPEGSTVRGRRSKASVAVGHLGYRKVTGI
jgi:hypothetical protein